MITYHGQHCLCNPNTFYPVHHTCTAQEHSQFSVGSQDNEFELLYCEMQMQNDQFHYLILKQTSCSLCKFNNKQCQAQSLFYE